MKRVYYKKPKRKQIQMQAMLNMQKARREIDPALLEKARNAIAEALMARHENEGKATGKGQESAPLREPQNQTAQRAKTFEDILKGMNNATQRAARHDEMAEAPEKTPEKGGADARMEVIDIKKNLSVIQRFIEMNTDNKGMQREIHKLMAERLQ